ncbi:MAG: iron-containing alcohol dehydrogenase [Candidatus Theseobacter exili]|nr:iron-containing alcohol dehydrogenase [Candidatus Theseobacter exili]
MVGDKSLQFEFATATRIIFGTGTLCDIGSHAAKLGHKVFVVTGRNSDRAARLQKLLELSGLEYVLFHVSGEPTTESVLEGSRLARQSKCDMVIGIGGGSVLDSGKAIAALLTNEGHLFDYLEIVGKGNPLTKAASPYIAVPTTAGTGSEVTCNAVLCSQKHHVKVSMRSPLMLPYMAIVDPELTMSLPKLITANTGLDALTQLMEAYVSISSNPLTDGICVEGLNSTARSLVRVCNDGNDISARENMCIASLFGGLALSNAKLGAVHGFAGSLGGMYTISHGALCARLLPFVMEANIQALRKRMPDSIAMDRYHNIARILTGKSKSKAEDAVYWVKEFCESMNILPLSSFGLKFEDFPEAVDKALKSSSMKGNPIQLTNEKLLEILSKAM